MKPAPRPGKCRKPRTNPRHEPLAPASHGALSRADVVAALYAERDGLQEQVNVMRESSKRLDVSAARHLCSRLIQVEERLRALHQPIHGRGVYVD